MESVEGGRGVFPCDASRNFQLCPIDEEKDLFSYNIFQLNPRSDNRNRHLQCSKASCGSGCLR